MTGASVKRFPAGIRPVPLAARLSKKIQSREPHFFAQSLPIAATCRPEEPSHERRACPDRRRPRLRNRCAAATPRAGGGIFNQGGAKLIGGSARDILIADLGDAQLRGGGAGSILIGGSTICNDNLSALETALTEWSSGDSYAARTAALAATFNTSTVYDNGKVNLIQGDKLSQSDWFFADLASKGGDALSGVGAGDLEVSIS